MPQLRVPIADTLTSSWGEGAGDGDAFAFDELDEGISFDGGSDDAASYWRSIDFFPPPLTPDLLRFTVGSMAPPEDSAFPHVLLARVRNSDELSSEEISAHVFLYVNSTNGNRYIAAVSCLELNTDNLFETMSYALTAAQVTSLAGGNPNLSYANLEMGIRPVPTGVPPSGSVSLDCSALEVSAGNASFAHKEDARFISQGEAFTSGDHFYRVGIDFDQGSTTWIQSGGFVTALDWNRDLGDIFNSPGPGDAKVELDNEDGRFTPENAGSPYAGFLLPTKELTLDVTYQGCRYPLFKGRIEAFSVKPEIGDRTAMIEATDRMGKLADAVVDMGVTADINIGSLFTEVLSHAGVPATDYNVVSLSEIVPFAYFSGQRATSVFEELLELGDYKIHADAQGKIQVQDRYFNILGDVVGSYHEFASFGYKFDGDDVKNSVRVTSAPRKVATSAASISWIDNEITIPGCGHAGFELEFVDPDDPNENGTPCDSVTLLAHAATRNVSINLEIFAKSAVCTVTNVHPFAATLTQFVLQGFALQKTPDIGYVTKNTSSQTVFGERDITIESDLFADRDYTKDFAGYLLELNREAAPTVRASLMNVFPDIYANDLGDLVKLINSNAAVNSDYTILSVDHRVSWENGLQHTVRMGCRFWKDSNWLVLDHATRGKLASGNKLAL